MTPTHDLAVAYRVCPFVSRNRPAVFAEDKLKLATLCARSFKASLTGLRVKLFVLLDGCPPAYESLFRDLWPDEDLVIGHHGNIGNLRTYGEQCWLLAAQDASDLVYFAEDDYFYLPDTFAEMTRLLREHPELQFLTPYDHPDYYTLDLHRGPSPSRNVAGRIWTSRLSTTMTFLTTREQLRKSFHPLHSYARGNSDLGMWMSLTKQRIFNPLNLLLWERIESKRLWGNSVRWAWRRSFEQSLFGKPHTLWAPTPSIATHMVAGLEARDTDWLPRFRDASPDLF